MKADWLSVEEARTRILRSVAPLPPERRTLLDALGSVLAEAVHAPLDLPPWDNSAMDGFAVRSADIAGATAERPRELRIIEDVPAGTFPTRPLGVGEATRVMTGAPVPEGADGVVRVEHTDGGHGIGTAEARVRVMADSDAGRNIRRRGEDLRRDALVLQPGRRLGAAGIGVAASLGRSRLRVLRRPRVAVMASGNELVDVHGFSEVLAGRRIVSSNSYALAAQLAEAGLEAVDLGIAPDDPADIRHHLEAARGCDALVTTAGISVGEHDHLRAVLGELDTEVLFWRIRMRPGSPTAFGRVGALGGTPWFGLPGNPVSCMVGFELFARPALLRMAGHAAVFRPTLEVRLEEAVPAPPGLTHFPRARLSREPDGAWSARLTGAQGSGILSSMAAADALLVIPPAGEAASPGDEVVAIVLDGAPLQEEPGY